MLSAKPKKSFVSALFLYVSFFYICIFGVWVYEKKQTESFRILFFWYGVIFTLVEDASKVSVLGGKIKHFRQIRGHYLFLFLPKRVVVCQQN